MFQLNWTLSVAKLWKCRTLLAAIKPRYVSLQYFVSDVEKIQGNIRFDHKHMEYWQELNKCCEFELLNWVASMLLHFIQNIKTLLWMQNTRSIRVSICMIIKQWHYWGYHWITDIKHTKVNPVLILCVIFLVSLTKLTDLNTRY